jgi:dTMP kinase
LAEALQGRGLTLVVTREPGGSPGAEAIRKLLLEGEEARWNPRAEALLFAAARADHVEKTIQPALERGEWVLSDPLPRQQPCLSGEAGGLGIEAVRDLHRFGSLDFLPDRTLVLTLDEAEGALRARARDGHLGDRIGSRPPSYHAAVDAGFRKMAAGAGAGQAGRRQRDCSDGNSTAALYLGRPAAMIAGPRQGGGGVSDAWASRRLHHAGCLPARRAWARRRSRRRCHASACRGARPSVDLPGWKRRRSLRSPGCWRARSHPDFRWLERLERPTGGLARNISVDQVRSLGELLAVTPSMSPWRAIVIDAVDDLEASAANALLKMLEEPPANTSSSWSAMRRGDCCRRSGHAAAAGVRQARRRRHDVTAKSLSSRRKRSAVDRICGRFDRRAMAIAELDLAPLESEALAYCAGDADNSRRSKLASALGPKAPRSAMPPFSNWCRAHCQEALASKAMRGGGPSMPTPGHERPVQSRPACRWTRRRRFPVGYHPRVGGALDPI